MLTGVKRSISVASSAGLGQPVVVYRVVLMIHPSIIIRAESQRGGTKAGPGMIALLVILLDNQKQSR
jgi:hypothetical protein